ncbi:hypothetical protein DW877_18990, partial [[Clostridium] symbiosum]
LNGDGIHLCTGIYFFKSALVKQVRTPPVRPADGVVGLFYESFVPREDCCELGLRAKIKSAEHAPAL